VAEVRDPEPLQAVDGGAARLLEIRVRRLVRGGAIGDRGRLLGLVLRLAGRRRGFRKRLAERPERVLRRHSADPVDLHLGVLVNDLEQIRARGELPQARRRVRLLLERSDVHVRDAIAAQESRGADGVGRGVHRLHRALARLDLRLRVAALLDVVVPAEHGGKPGEHRDAAEVLVGRSLCLEHDGRAADVLPQPRHREVLAGPLLLEVSQPVERRADVRGEVAADGRASGGYGS
jgi:hypothetical protein